jgi:hypothetical protein
MSIIIAYETIPHVNYYCLCQLLLPMKLFHMSIIIAYMDQHCKHNEIPLSTHFMS